MSLEQLQYNVIAILDTETTGLPSTKILNNETVDKWPHIIQFTFIIFDISKNQILEISDDIIHLDTSVQIHEKSIECHGITHEISQKSDKYIASSLEKLMISLQVYQVECIVGHNISFDVDMVHAEYIRQLRTMEQPNILKNRLNAILYYPKFCTMKHTIDICKILVTRPNGASYFKFPRLGELCQHLFQISVLNLHNSLIDTLATLRCYYQLIYQTDLLDVNEEFSRKWKELCQEKEKEVANMKE